MRKRREWYPGACYHIMARGNRRSAIFREEEDHRLFMRLLQETGKKYRYDLHAYCLMTNHFHLELTTYSDPIWIIMKKIMHQYAMIFNHRYGLEGHLFDSRYTSCLVGDDRYFLEVSRYIHLNPVKARMVREPLDYHPSSYGDYVTDKKGIAGDLLDKTRVLSLFGGDPREQYRMFVEGKISHAEQEMLIMKDMGENELWLPW